MRTCDASEIRYSALNNRLLLPPSTATEPGTVGPTDRRSNPRMLYSPPSVRRSKIGRFRSHVWVGSSRQGPSPTEEMYSACARKPTEVRDCSRLKKIASTRGL